MDNPPLRRANAGWHAAAAAIYVAVSVIFIGAGAPLGRVAFGSGSDPFQFIWCLAWFPWAIAHHQSLLYTHLMWQPLGVPLMLVSSVPLLSLALIPVTALLGPVTVYNLMILAAPVLSALAGYALCLRITRQPPAALLGGFVFGFSGYEMAADYATPNLSFTFLLPCLLLLVLRRLAGAGSRAATLGLAVLVLAAQFFISIEVFATLVFFGFTSWLCAYAMQAEARPALRGLLADAAITGAITLLVLSPVLAEMLRHRDFVNLPAIWPFYFVNDPANFIVPTSLALLGTHLGLSKHLPGILQEQDAYLGLPLVCIIVAFARSRMAPRFLVPALLVAAIASLGPNLWVCGFFTGLPMPWWLCLHLPLLSAALPARLALFTSLAAAVLLAVWAARSEGGFSLRYAAGILACLALLPAPHPWIRIPASSFFAPGQVQAALGPNPRLLVLPFGPNGGSTYWQMESGFSYQQAGGYFGFPPRAMQGYKAVHEMFANKQGPDFTAELITFCAGTGTQYVVAGPGTSTALRQILDGLGWARRPVDDAVVYTVPAHGLNSSVGTPRRC